jgi:hypothetical protein
VVECVTERLLVTCPVDVPHTVRVRGPEAALFSRKPAEYGRDIPRKKRGDGRIVDRLNDTGTVDTRPPDALPLLHAPPPPPPPPRVIVSAAPARIKAGTGAGNNQPCNCLVVVDGNIWHEQQRAGKSRPADRVMP